MIPRNFYSIFGWVASFSIVTSPAWPEPNSEPGSVHFETCSGCHSRPGTANAVPRYQVPKLGGQQPGYIISALKAYSSGDRNHPSMRGNAEGLSETELTELASYLASQELTENDDNYFGDIKLGEEKAVTCSGCHGVAGTSSDENLPHLAGQYQSYLIKVLQDYQQGQRENPMMAAMVKDLSAEDIQNITAFYASRDKGLGVVDRD